MEITRRDDIGADLKAPSAARGGVATASYALVPLVQPGDVVVHYDSRQEAIVGVSVASSPAEPAPIYWVARGSYARRAGEQARWLPGLRVALDQYRQLEPPGHTGRNPPAQGRAPGAARADSGPRQRAADLLPVDSVPGHAPHLPELPGQDAPGSHQLVSQAPRHGRPGGSSTTGIRPGIASRTSRRGGARRGREGRAPRKRAGIPARPGGEGGSGSTRDERGHRVLQARTGTSKMSTARKAMT